MGTTRWARPRPRNAGGLGSLICGIYPENMPNSLQIFLRAENLKARTGMIQDDAVSQ
jgi:hypothetical protein